MMAGRCRRRRVSLGVLLHLDDAGLIISPEIVALAGALTDAREHRDAAVQLRDVVDELHDDDRLADAGATEGADLAALRNGQIRSMTFDAGGEDLRPVDWSTSGERRGDRLYRSAFTGPCSSTASPVTLNTRPMTPSPTGSRWEPGVHHFHAAAEAPVVLMATARSQLSPRCCCTRASAW